jgi:phosphoglycerol transferase MdoB-like AlkP superfamily enzyme
MILNYFTNSINISEFLLWILVLVLSACLFVIIRYMRNFRKCWIKLLNKVTLLQKEIFRFTAKITFSSTVHKSGHLLR